MDSSLLKRSLDRIAEESAEKFIGSKWPGPESEEWRGTSLSKYDLSGFAVPEDHGEPKTGIGDDEPLGDNFDIRIGKRAGMAAEIRFSKNLPHGITIYDPLINGDVTPERGLQITGLAESAAESADCKPDFLALSSFRDSLFIIISDNTVLDKPLLVEYEASGRAGVFLPNLFVGAGKGSEVKIIQKIKVSGSSSAAGYSYIASGAGSKVHSATVTDIADGSVLFLNRSFDLSDKSLLSDFQSYTGGTLIKSRTEVNLNGEKGDARLYGAVIAEEKNHIDLRTVQHHREKDCFSQAEIKSIVRDRGRSIYQGLIEVDEDAPLTDAYLVNNNIVLNDGARADSIPSLKIRNNDVKCSHGSTTGKIDEEQILYLTSRGLGRVEAGELILEGFLSRVYDQLPEPVSSYCSPFIMEKLKQPEAVS